MSDATLPVGTRVVWKRQNVTTIWEDVIREYSPSRRYVCMDEEEWVPAEQLVILEILPPKERLAKPEEEPEEIDWDDIERHAREMMRRSYPNTRSMVKGAMDEALRNYFGEAETAEQVLREVRREVGEHMRGTWKTLASPYDCAPDWIQQVIGRRDAYRLVNRLLRNKLKEVRGE